MNVRNILLGLTVILSLTACEKEMLIDEKDSTSLITINALVSPDTVVTAHVTEAGSIDYFNSMIVRNDNDMYADQTGQMKDLYLDSAFYEKALREADVKLIVNNASTSTMRYDANSLGYVSDYKPQAGDEIRIVVNSKSNMIGGEQGVELDPVEAVTVVPQTPTMKILSSQLSTSQKELYEVQGKIGGKPIVVSDYWGSDTVMEIKIAIYDPKEENNYYRLKVRSVGASREYSDSGVLDYVCVDFFKSEDKLLFDSKLQKGYGFIPAFFTDVFDDVLMTGKRYEFSVTTRMRKNSEIKPYVIVELQHLSPDLYYYLKDLEVFRISEYDLYSSPLRVNSNVTGGWGILGAMNFETHIVPFENKRYE